METQSLRGQKVFPSEDILKQAIGGIYPVYESLTKTVIEAEYGLTGEWNYYKDGKSWLCKITHRKKTAMLRTALHYAIEKMPQEMRRGANEEIVFTPVIHHSSYAEKRH